MTAALQQAPSSWQAELRLTFARRAGRTVLARREHRGPLVVQRPFYPERYHALGDPCHVYVIHPPGGIVGGDHLQLHAELQPGAHAVITTPAATKFYRAAPGREALLQQSLQVRAATLEWLPQETIYFNRAQVRTTTRIALDATSRCLAWEISCYGRRAGDEPFVEGRIRQRLELWVDERPVLLDHLNVEADDMLHAAWGLQDRHALGSLLAYPATGDDVNAVRELQLEQTRLSCTLVDGALLCRCVCTDGAQVKSLLLQMWQCLRPRILQREAVLPRIWAT